MRKDRFFEAFDYESGANDFNQAFFFKNLYKCLVAVLTYKASGFISFTDADTPAADLGAGAGAFALAWNACFPERKAQISLLDVSAKQLELAGQVLTATNMKNFAIRHQNTGEAKQSQHCIKLASYWLCAQQDNSLIDVIGSLNADLAVIVDYKHIIAQFVQRISSKNECVLLNASALALPIREKQLFSDYEINTHALLVRGPIMIDHDDRN